MRDVYDFAKYFLQCGADSVPNTYDGNMKLQKLLVLANLICLAEYGDLLFNDEVLAFKNGCVVEKVRLRYKSSYKEFLNASKMYDPDFSSKEYRVVHQVMDIFGNATARELSEINHTFKFWQEAYERGITPNGYHDKKLSVVNMNSHEEDVQRMKDILQAHKESEMEAVSHEVINGITFYYDNMELTDEMINQLEVLSLVAEDDSYTVYLDDGKLVAY